MRRTLFYRIFGISLIGLVALSIGNRPPAHAGAFGVAQAPDGEGGGFRGSPAIEDKPAPVAYVAAAPMTVEATRTWMKLQQKIRMNFPNETSLDDIVKYVEAVTQDKDNPESGIEVYVDLQGLQDADKTMASTIMINLRSVPLATSLKLALAQLGLSYRIQNDGILVISSFLDDNRLVPEVDANVEILQRLTSMQREIQSLRREVQVLHGGTIGQPRPAAGSANPAVKGNVGGMM